VLDVWEGEPAIDTALLEKVALGTPHIAGYSLDGKLRGTEMIYQAACEHFGISAQGWSAVNDLPERRALTLGEAGQDTLRAAVFHSYDVRHDDRLLRNMASLDADECPEYFDRLRKDYPVRFEFSGTTLKMDHRDAPVYRSLEALGFDVVATC
jgi:erythronate-4-phosphate dehydrogenase